MNTKKSMDEAQVCMLCTDSEEIYMAERAKGDYFSSDSDPETAGKGLTKEPTVGFCAIGTYPLHYLLEIFKIAKKNKVSHMKIEMGRENRPIRLEFLSYDNLNLVNGSPKQVKTWAYLAPRIDTDYPDLTVAQLEERIKVHENEIVLLKNQLPKEAPKPL